MRGHPSIVKAARLLCGALFVLCAAARAAPAPGDGGVAAAVAAPLPPPLAQPQVRSYDSAGAALQALLARGPRVLAFGEFHETIKGPKVPSSLRRFTDELLPLLMPHTSDLVVETWISQGDCGKKEEAVVADVAKTTARPAATEAEIVTMVRRAKEGGVKPYALAMSCEDYRAIYTDQGVDYDKMLTVLTRELRGKVELVLKRRAQPVAAPARPDGGAPVAVDPARRLILVYGGALHNDLYPRPELANYTFGPPLQRLLGAEYLEVDVFVPEYIQGSAAMRKEPWYALAQKAARPGKALLVERGPGSFIILFPRTRKW